MAASLTTVTSASRTAPSSPTSITAGSGSTANGASARAENPVSDPALDLVFVAIWHHSPSLV